MKLSSHKLLKLITSKHEVSLADLIPLIDKRYDDYRDYYPLAQLCTANYIKSELTANGEPHRDEKLLASIFYSFATGEKRVNQYVSTRVGVNPNNDMFYATPKSELYFAEARAKRSDRIFSMAIGIIVGICTAVLMVKLNIK